MANYALPQKKLIGPRAISDFRVFWLKSNLKRASFAMKEKKLDFATQAGRNG
jgi:hypothetical protein